MTDQELIILGYINQANQKTYEPNNVLKIDKIMTTDSQIFYILIFIKDHTQLCAINKYEFEGYKNIRINRIKKIMAIKTMMEYE